MPDQSSAAEEHAILEEITAPLANLPDDAGPIAGAADLPLVLRGYDRDAVDAYAQSRREAEDRLEVARDEGLRITAAAEQRLKNLDVDTDRTDRPARAAGMAGAQTGLLSALCS